jgi:D-arabinose 1-dehydrogenase-like Zn-dependent alcohol dehydrogenase
MPTDARVVVIPQQAGAGPEVIDMSLPDPAPHQVVVKQYASGICHSQLHTIHNPRATAAVLGHESTGEVVAVGEQVEGLAVGDKAVRCRWSSPTGVLRRASTCSPGPPTPSPTRCSW